MHILFVISRSSTILHGGIKYTIFCLSLGLCSFKLRIHKERDCLDGCALAYGYPSVGKCDRNFYNPSLKNEEDGVKSYDFSARFNLEPPKEDFAKDSNDIRSDDKKEDIKKSDEFVDEVKEDVGRKCNAVIEDVEENEELVKSPLLPEDTKEEPKEYYVFRCGYDCSMFMIKYVDYFARGLQYTFCEDDMSDFKVEPAMGQHCLP